MSSSSGQRQRYNLNVLSWFKPKSDDSRYHRPLVPQVTAPSRSQPRTFKIRWPFRLTNARQFQPPDWDLSLVDRAYQTEGYIQQALDRYIELMFKSGWDFVGKDPKAVNYIRQRFALMEEATQMSTHDLLVAMSDDLVKYANSILIKVRNNNFPWPAGIKVQPAYGRSAPVVAYFPAPVPEMEVERDDTGRVTRYQQNSSDGQLVIFRAEDVVHITYRRPKNSVWGYPFVLAAIDDVNALRMAEENVLRLIYRNLFPLLHGKVGSEDNPGKDAEVRAFQDVLNNMDLESGIATTERFSLDAVAMNQIIDASPYLKHFELRVFTDLGVSETLMGRGATASRASADNLSAEMRDRLRAFQSVLASGFNVKILHELLLEGGFDPILHPEQRVELVFHEIDIDSKIKLENHLVYLYTNNAITEDELRTALGRDPITDRSKLYLNTITIPTALAKAESSGLASPQSVSNRAKPKNQHSSLEEWLEDFLSCVEANYRQGATDWQDQALVWLLKSEWLSDMAKQYLARQVVSVESVSVLRDLVLSVLDAVA